jgi:hypothetical protein
MLLRDADGNLHIGLPMKFAEEPGRLDPRLPPFTPPEAGD